MDIPPESMANPTRSNPGDFSDTPSPNPSNKAGEGVRLKAVKLGSEKGQTVIDQTWETGKKRLLGGLDHISGTVRKVSDELRQTNNAGLAQYAEVVAEKTDLLYEYFQNKEVGALLKDGEKYARNNPEIFLAGAFILGFIGARFLKSHPEAESQYI
ncbi:MAG: hypothetical protein WD425_07520 [Nitrospirales bacterium]